MNTYDYRKENLDIHDFMNHLKGLVYHLGGEIMSTSIDLESPKELVTYKQLCDFVGLNKQWIDNTEISNPHLSGTYTYKTK